MNGQKVQIAELIQADILKLSDPLRAWAESHLIDPRQETLCEVSGEGKQIKVWLVTDNTGLNDSPYRVVFDEKVNKFGLEITLQDGKHGLMGIYGGFAETIENM